MDVESIAGVDTPPLLYVGLVCISVVPVALVFGIRGVLEHQHFESINERIFVSIVSFVFLSILVLPYSSVILHEFREREGAAKEAIVGAGLFGILAFGASGGVGRPEPIFAALVFLAATAEEFVFRVLLPHGLTRLLKLRSPHLSAGAILILICSQLSFALSHTAVGSVIPGVHGLETAALFTAGVFYATLVRLCGVGATAAIHASLNLHLLATPGKNSPPMTGAVALCLLSILCYSLCLANSRDAGRERRVIP